MNFSALNHQSLFRDEGILCVHHKSILYLQPLCWNIGHISVFQAGNAKLNMPTISCEVSKFLLCAPLRNKSKFYLANMSNYLVLRISSVLNRFQNALHQLFRSGGYPPEALALAGMPSMHDASHNNPSDRFSLKQLIGDGLLWAVPKHRRTVEKRLNRKFGYPEYVWKPLKVKTNLRVCNQCGHDHEVGVLCPHCYEKVRKETELMQEKIQEELGLQPVEQDVIVLYEGEKNEQSKELANGKRIVEMPKPRPMWFTKNLLQKSTQQPADTKEVKPTNLA